MSFHERNTQQGKVKWYNPTKGFGFIEPDSGGADIFFHRTALERSGIENLSEGQIVEYTTRKDKKTQKISASSLSVIK